MFYAVNQNKWHTETENTPYHPRYIEMEIATNMSVLSKRHSCDNTDTHIKLQIFNADAIQKWGQNKNNNDSK